jgi:hypothetical protein
MFLELKNNTKSYSLPFKIWFLNSINSLDNFSSLVNGLKFSWLTPWGTYLTILSPILSPNTNLLILTVCFEIPNKASHD